MSGARRPRCGAGFVGGLLLAVLLLVAAADPAGADPVAPTDYQATVVEVSPPVEGLTVAVVGGDAFVELVNRTGGAVRVPGYEGEPYLRFGAAGLVEENERSPSAVLNRNRLPGDGEAEGEALAATDPLADPVWRVVARDGRYAWHDHRTHWMSPQPPLGRAPGDVILDGVLPLLAGDAAVAVRVQVRWLDPPAAFPLLLAGSLVAAAVVAMGLALRRRGDGPQAMGAGAVAVAAAVATAVSWRERAGLPPGTGPPVARLLLAAVALGLSLIAVGLRVARRPARPAGVGIGAVAVGLVAALELAVWAWLRRDGLGKPVLPVGAAWAPLDRISVAASLVVATVATLLFTTELFRATGPPSPTGPPAAPSDAGEPAGSG